MTTTNLPTLKIHRLTQTQYETAIENGTVEENALYLTPDEAAVKLSDIATVSEVEAYLGI